MEADATPVIFPPHPIAGLLLVASLIACGLAAYRVRRATRRRLPGFGLLAAVIVGGWVALLWWNGRFLLVWLDDVILVGAGTLFAASAVAGQFVPNILAGPWRPAVVRYVAWMVVCGLSMRLVG